MLFGRLAARASQAWKSYRFDPREAFRPRNIIQSWRSIGYWTLHVVNFGCALHLFGEHVAALPFVEGPSMFPTMAMTGELTLELKWIDPHELKRGDLVTYISPIDPTRKVCKRVTGLPGDIICVDPTGEYAPSTEHVIVPRNHIWVTGDNLPWSRDSRLYGPVPLGLVKGKLYARVWPLRDMAIFRSTFEYID
ncbi:peptidase S24/S26A/S26B/S26C [Trametes punicea]|nr:peptidase S24/S26A/S26B/S26C [Trametes punicea]